VADRFSLAGRVVLVTGASRGIDRASAQALGAAGAAVACAARSLEQVEATAARLVAAGHRAHALRMDVTRSGRVAAAVQETEAALGRIDILVNNAAIMLEKKTVEVVTGRTVYLDGGQTIAW
jgi:NAD(P)-dependent dehydrogenase (short-subunit alcohol dehydrogenase family)